jgi:gamma-glutamylcyclotransferase (GGCT)/AIG2-like uncharacterized protein YtfP
MHQTYPILYAAYGANTNREHMRTRCPTATYVGNCTLHDFALVFRGVADVIDARGEETVCALWEIQPKDERALDTFEGFPFHYTKRYARIQYRGQSRLVMFYVMAGNRRDVHEPPQSYEQTLRAGYRQCAMPERQITRAVRTAKRSEARMKTYRGAWVQKDIKAKAAKYPPRQWPLIEERDLSRDFPEYPDWMMANFDLTKIEGL